MSTNHSWLRYHKEGIIESDPEVLTMLQEVVDTIQLLERIYGHDKAQLVVSGMIPTYLSLSNIAYSRNLKDIPHL